MIKPRRIYILVAHLCNPPIWGAWTSKKDMWKGLRAEADMLQRSPRNAMDACPDYYVQSRPYGDTHNDRTRIEWSTGDPIL